VWEQLKPSPEKCLKVINEFIKIIKCDKSTSPITKKEFIVFGESLANCFEQIKVNKITKFDKILNFIKIKKLNNFEAINELATSYNNPWQKNGKNKLKKCNRKSERRARGFNGFSRIRKKSTYISVYP
jgi:hypothetical protein